MAARWSCPSDLAAGGGADRIALAAGEYEEEVLLDRPVRLRGRCAELVTIEFLKADGLDMQGRVDDRESLHVLGVGCLELLDQLGNCGRHVSHPLE